MFRSNRSLKIPLPSPAMVVALIALVASFTGGAVAATKINGKNIKKGTITGKALKKNTLGGTQINESKLAKVPTATRADSAASADNATAIAGVSAAGIVKGAATIYTNQLSLANGENRALISVPGFVDIDVACSGGSLIAFRITSRSTNLNYSLSRAVSPNSSSSVYGGTLNIVGADVTLAATSLQTLTGNVWQPSSGRVVSFTASSVICSTSATATASN